MNIKFENLKGKSNRNLVLEIKEMIKQNNISNNNDANTFIYSLIMNMKKENVSLDDALKLSENATSALFCVGQIPELTDKPKRASMIRHLLALISQSDYSYAINNNNGPASKEDTIKKVEREVLYKYIPNLVSKLGTKVNDDDLELIITSDKPLTTIRQILEKEKSEFLNACGDKFTNTIDVADNVYGRTIDIVDKIENLSKAIKDSNAMVEAKDVDYMVEYYVNEEVLDIDNPNKKLYLVPYIPNEYITLVEKIFEVYLFHKPSLQEIKRVLLTITSLYISNLEDDKRLCNDMYNRKEINKINEANNDVFNMIIEADTLYEDLCNQQIYEVVDVRRHNKNNEYYVILDKIEDRNITEIPLIYVPYSIFNSDRFKVLNKHYPFE